MVTNHQSPITNHQMDFFEFTPAFVEQFLLVFFRISGLVIFAPIFGSKMLPAMLKIGMSLILAIILFPLLPKENFQPTGETYAFALMVFRELSIGFIIGFAAQLVFTGIQIGGELIGFEMGYNVINVIDPQGSHAVPIISQFQNILATFCFLAIGGHHFLLQALVNSFEEIQIATFQYPPMFGKHLIKMFSFVFVIAIKISAPTMAALFITDVVLAIIARAAPQVDVFMMSFPLKIAVGLLALAASLQIFSYVLQQLFRQMQTDISLLLIGN